MKRVQFNLTQKHIDEGVPLHGAKCAIALSVEERFNTSKNFRIAVAARSVIFEKDPEFIFVNLSKRMLALMDRFDDKERIELDAPMQFYLNLTDDVLEKMK